MQHQSYSIDNFPTMYHTYSLIPCLRTHRLPPDPFLHITIHNFILHLRPTSSSPAPSSRYVMHAITICNNHYTYILFTIISTTQDIQAMHNYVTHFGHQIKQLVTYTISILRSHHEIL